MNIIAAIKSIIFRKIVTLAVLIVAALLTFMFLVSENICIKIAGVGNIFFILWVLLADPLKSRIKIETGEANKDVFQFLLVAALIWAFSAIFRFTNMCGALSEIARSLGRLFVK